MNSTESTMDFDLSSQNIQGQRPSRKKNLLLGTVGTITLIIAAIIVLAVIFSNRYLDRVRDFYPVNSFSFNGYEIVNDNGLYYLTRDGKKVSKIGYTQLISLSAEAYGADTSVFATDDDVKIYDHFIGRKEDSKNYFIIDGEGKELMIDGDNWAYKNTVLPFVIFEDSVTGEYGVFSLENFDSDISESTEQELTLKVFDGYKTEILYEKNMLKGYIVLESSDAGADAIYSFVNSDGSVMFKSVYNYETARLTMDDGSYKYFVLTGDEVLYDITGNKLEENIASVFETGDCVIVIARGAKLTVYTPSGNDFSISNTEYKLYDDTTDRIIANFRENVLWAASQSTAKTTLFNLITGEKLVCDNVEDAKQTYYADELVVCKTSSGYTYVDTKTGKTVLVSQYGDMETFSGYANVLFSPSEPRSGDVSAILHFISTEKSPVTKTLYSNQSIECIFDDRERNSAYIITTTDTEKKTVYSPFGKETAKFDRITIIDAFAEGAPIAVASSFDYNKFEFIDVASGEIVYSVSLSNGEKMALTSIEYVDTYVLFANYSEGVEFGVFKTVEKNTDGDVVKESFYAFSRGNAMTQLKDPKSTSALKMTELGDDIKSISASTFTSYSYSWSASKYMTVSTAQLSTTVYEITESRELKKISDVPYAYTKLLRYGDELDQIYLMVGNEQSGYGDEVALYTVDGEMILGFHSDITVSDDGEYIIAQRMGGYGAYKYYAEKGRIKQLLDFEFYSMRYAGDGGFLVQLNAEGDYFIYDGKSPAKSEPITSIHVTTDISWDEELGKFVKSTNTYYSISGKLFLHCGEGKEIIDTSTVGANATATQSLVSYSPTLVNFYDTNGNLIQSEVIYPASTKNDFEIPDGEWYSVRTESAQDVTTAVTTFDVIYGMKDSGGVVNVYKGHTAK